MAAVSTSNSCSGEDKSEKDPRGKFWQLTGSNIEARLPRFCSEQMNMDCRTCHGNGGRKERKALEETGAVSDRLKLRCFWNVQLLSKVLHLYITAQSMEELCFFNK